MNLYLKSSEKLAIIPIPEREKQNGNNIECLDVAVVIDFKKCSVFKAK